MQIDLTTPAMLFPAISLLLLAYTNRFLGIAGVIRNLNKEAQDERTILQINLLRERIQIIRHMQEVGALSFFICVASMLCIYLEYQKVGSWLFAASLVFLLYSLWLSVREIRVSVKALDIHLAGQKEKCNKSA